MSYVRNLLARNERIVRVARDHWITLLPTILVDVAIIIVVLGLSIGGFLLFPPFTLWGLLLSLIPIGHLLFRLWVWWNRQYVVTNRRIIQIIGVFNKHVSDTSLEKINDIVMTQSAWGRMLRFGDIEIISGSDIGVNVFHRIADPIGFKKELLDQKGLVGSAAEKQPERASGPKGSGVSDVPALIAELDDLRKKGLLTDAEFEAKKQELLDRI